MNKPKLHFLEMLVTYFLFIGCPGGFYGTNCSIACPDTNCYCHIETGTCQVCKPGYQGYLCTLGNPCAIVNIQSLDLLFILYALNIDIYFFKSFKMLKYYFHHYDYFTANENLFISLAQNF